MPGLITHYLCAEAVLRTLPPEARDLIAGRRGLYNVGAQGPDIFFYDLPGLLRRGRRDLGSRMHHGGVSNFMARAAGRLNGLNRRDKAALFAYLCGYVTHYCLDARAHPYVYYKSGFPTGGGRGVKYSVRHRAFETAVDVAMLAAATGERPNQRQLWRMAYARKADAFGVPALLAGAITEAYGVIVTPAQVLRSMAYTRWITRAAQSRKGRRKRLLAAAERFVVGDAVCSSIIHPQTVDEGQDCLNLAKRPWTLPYDAAATRTDSFPEIFDAACEWAKGMIAALFAYYQGEADLGGVLDAVGDISLKTGAEAGLDVQFQFCERP